MSKKSTLPVKTKAAAKRKLQPVICAVVLDESGSMNSCTRETIAGFNEYLQDRKTDSKDVDIRFSLTKFSSFSKLIHQSVPVDKVEPLNTSTYRPDGMTALYDAVGETIKSIELGMDKDTKVLVMIMTDGHENQSIKFNIHQISELIRSKQAQGNWTFTFMGAGQDSWLAGGSMGIPAANTVNYSATSTKGAMKGMSIATRSVAYSSATSTSNLMNVGGISLCNAEQLEDASVDLTTGSITLASAAPSKKKKTTKK